MITVILISAIAITTLALLDNIWMQYALIVWIVENADTQPSAEQIVEYKKFVAMHFLQNLHKPKQ